MSKKEDLKKHRAEIVRLILTTSQISKSWFEKNWPFLLSCSTGLGFWWLFHYVREFQIPMPLGLSYLSSLVVFMAFAGAYFILNMMIIVFLPIYAKILIGEETLKKSLIYGKKGSFKLFFNSSGLLLILYSYVLSLTMFHFNFGKELVWACWIPVIVILLLFFLLNFLTKERRKAFFKISNSNVSGIYISVIWISVIFFLSAVVINGFFDGDYDYHRQHLVWHWVIGFTVLGAFLTFLSFAFIRLSANDEARNFSIFLITLLAGISILMPQFSTTMGQLSLGILKIGGGVPVCYEISSKNFEELPIELRKAHPNIPVLYDFFSAGDRIHVSLDKSESRIFSFPRSLVVSESRVGGFGRNSRDNQVGACVDGKTKASKK